MEQDPLTIWESVRTAIQQTMEQARQEHGEVVVKAIGITNQRKVTCRRGSAPLFTMHAYQKTSLLALEREVQVFMQKMEDGASCKRASCQIHSRHRWTQPPLYVSH